MKLKNIIHPIRSYREYKGHQQRKLERELGERESRIIADTLYSRDKMVGKPCALGKDQKCFKECIHFSDAEVIRENIRGHGECVSYKKAFCKLWGGTI